MKLIGTLIVLMLSFQVYCQTIQGAIYVTGNDVTVRVKPSQTINLASNAVASINVTVSVNSNGQPIGNAPAVSSATSFIPGVAATVLSTTMIDNRYTYTFLITGNTTSAINWPANVEQDLLFVDFPANGIMTGQFPRLEDQTNDGGGGTQQSYFYTDFSGVDYTNYSSMFYAGGGGSLGTDSNGDQYVQSGTALPIKLGDFSAQVYTERSARLSWQTLREQNSDYFGIERSDDGLFWDEIGQVKAAGYSAGSLLYSYIDAALPNLRNKVDIFYYRLKMTDLDGTFAYSDVRAVDFRNNDQTSELRIFPNPASHLLHVDISGWEGAEAVQIRLADASGKAVLQLQTEGTGIIPVNVDLLPNGFYQLMLEKGANNTSKRVVIAR